MGARVRIAIIDVGFAAFPSKPGGAGAGITVRAVDTRAPVQACGLRTIVPGAVAEAFVGLIVVGVVTGLIPFHLRVPADRVAISAVTALPTGLDQAIVSAPIAVVDVAVIAVLEVADRPIAADVIDRKLDVR
jgi:hypothetical protein